MNTISPKIKHNHLTILYTIIALIAFAANSIFCRLALDEATIDAMSFSAIRLISGAITLVLVVVLQGRRNVLKSHNNWTSAFMLFLYAVAFSFAYIHVSAGSGALILFGTVQATMILAGLLAGERPHLAEVLGLFIALIGLVYLVFPGLTAISLKGFFLMVIAGISWGIYSLRGRATKDPLIDTSNAFILSLPFVFVIIFVMQKNIQLSLTGVLFAIISGAGASGLGYVVWYAALRGLTATRAAIVQLSVPVMAAIGGVIFLSETISIRLLISSILILGGIGIGVVRQGSFHWIKIALRQSQQET